MPDDEEPGIEDVESLYEWIVDHHPRWKETKNEKKRELLGETAGTEDEISPRIRDALDHREGPRRATAIYNIGVRPPGSCL